MRQAAHSAPWSSGLFMLSSGIPQQPQMSSEIRANELRHPEQMGTREAWTSGVSQSRHRPGKKTLASASQAVESQPKTPAREAGRSATRGSLPDRVRLLKG